MLAQTSVTIKGGKSNETGFLKWSLEDRKKCNWSVIADDRSPELEHEKHDLRRHYSLAYDVNTCPNAGLFPRHMRYKKTESITWNLKF